MYRTLKSNIILFAGFFVPFFLFSQYPLPLTVQFPCDVTIDCAAQDDLKATGEVRRVGGCISGVAKADAKLAITDACYKILRTWTVKSWCDYEPDQPDNYPTAVIHPGLNQITFTAAIDSLILRRNIGIGKRVTLRYITSGSVEIPGMIEGDVYSLIRVSDSTFLVDYNSTKQEAVSISGTGVGPHIFRYANSPLGIPATCAYLNVQYPGGNWHTGCCDPGLNQRGWIDDGDGYFQFTQSIKVIDTIAPQWVDCQPLTFCSFEKDCGPTFIELHSLATDDCTPAHQLKYDYAIDLDANGTTDIIGTGKDASGSYPIGSHSITFKVTDQCGNWNTCTRIFTIADCKKPTPICINGISVSLMESNDGGMATVWAESLESGESYDNCTPFEDLNILIERLSELTPGQSEPTPEANNMVTVTCDDLPPAAMSPVVEVVVWVGDAAGNWDYCITTIWVQDNMYTCAKGIAQDVRVQTLTMTGNSIEGVWIMLDGKDEPIAFSEQDGKAFLQGIPLDENITVRPVKKNDPMKHISTLDVIMLHKHILGLKKIKNPYTLIAADVDGNQKINVGDVHLLQDWILNFGLIPDKNRNWRFVQAEYVFPNPDAPGMYPSAKSIDSLRHDTLARFVGVLTGDISLGSVSGSLHEGETRSEEASLVFVTEDKHFRKGDILDIVFRAMDFEDLSGWQCGLEIDPTALSVLEIVPLWEGITHGHFGQSALADGILGISWYTMGGVTLADDIPLFSLRCKAHREGTAGDVISVTNHAILSEVYRMDECIGRVKLQTNPTIPDRQTLLQVEAMPNPFVDQVKFTWFMAHQNRVLIQCFDEAGRELWQRSGDYTEGIQSMVIPAKLFPSAGIYHYSITTGAAYTTGKIHFVEKGR